MDDATVRWFHHTDADLRPGDILEPQEASRWQHLPTYDPKSVYVWHENYDPIWGEQHGRHMYEVKPLGPLSPDPDADPQDPDDPLRFSRRTPRAQVIRPISGATTARTANTPEPTEDPDVGIGWDDLPYRDPGLEDSLETHGYVPTQTRFRHVTIPVPESGMTELEDDPYTQELGGSLAAHYPVVIGPDGELIDGSHRAWLARQRGDATMQAHQVIEPEDAPPKIHTNRPSVDWRL